MSQVSTTMAMTTTPLVTVVSCGMSSLSSITMAPSLMGLPAILGQCDVVLPPLLTLRCPGGIIGLASVPQQQPPSSMPLQAYANYAMGSQVGFFSEFSLPLFCILYVWCLFCCLLSTFRCHTGCHIHSLGLNHWGLHHCNPLESTWGICATSWWSLAHTGMHRVAAPLPWVGGALCCSISCSPAIPSIWWGIQLLGLSRESSNPSTFPAWWGGVFFSRFGSIQWHS